MNTYATAFVYLIINLLIPCFYEADMNITAAGMSNSLGTSDYLRSTMQFRGASRVRAGQGI